MLHQRIVPRPVGNHVSKGTGSRPNQLPRVATRAPRNSGEDQAGPAEHRPLQRPGLPLHIQDQECGPREPLHPEMNCTARRKSLAGAIPIAWILTPGWLVSTTTAIRLRSGQPLRSSDPAYRVPVA